MFRHTFALLATAGLVAFSVSTVRADNEVIEKIMKEGFKAPKGTPKLVEKVIDGKATDEEIKKLLELVKQLPAEKPPRGEEADWKEKTDALLKAAELCDTKDPEGPAKLKEAANCKACHRDHKPE